MKKVLRIALSVLIWGALLGYLIFAARYCRQQQHQQRLLRVNIEVTDSDQLRIVSPETVEQWLAQHGMAVEGMPLDSVNTERIREVLARHGFIKDSKAYVEQGGTLYVEVSQRKPIMRVKTEGGEDFYISEDMWVLPLQEGSAEYVPVVTGSFMLPFAEGYFGSIDEGMAEGMAEGMDPGAKKSDKNYTFLVKLINFVRLTEGDPFWGAEIVQINVVDAGADSWQKPEIELIPRVGNHVVAFGQLEDERQKLDKLLLFYRNVLDFEGWERYREINVKYKNQVVCKK